jgi:hypothetical protein
LPLILAGWGHNKGVFQVVVIDNQRGQGDNGPVGSMVKDCPAEAARTMGFAAIVPVWSLSYNTLFSYHLWAYLAALDITVS